MCAFAAVLAAGAAAADAEICTRRYVLQLGGWQVCTKSAFAADARPIPAGAEALASATFPGAGKPLIVPVGPPLPAIELKLIHPAKFQSLTIINGHVAGSPHDGGGDLAAYRDFARARIVSVATSDGVRARFALADTHEKQILRLPRPATPGWIRITIEAMHSGARPLVALTELAPDLEEYYVP